MDALLVITLYFVAVNLASAVAFAWDKYCAVKGQWRVSESTLLAIAAIGGSIGAIVAMRLLRHKTQKEPFKTSLRLVVVMQVIVLAALCVPSVRDAGWKFLLRTLGHGA